MEVRVPRRLERLTCGLLADEIEGERRIRIDVIIQDLILCVIDS